MRKAIIRLENQFEEKQATTLKQEEEPKKTKQEESEKNSGAKDEDKPKGKYESGGWCAIL